MASNSFPYLKLIERDPLLGHVNKRNVDFIFDLGNGAVRYQTNSLRARDTFPTKNKKILVVGASWTFGLGVASHQTWPELLEKTFCEYSFYNIATPGYLIDQTYLLLKQHLSTKQKYDLIIFAISFYQNNDRILSPYSWSPDSRKPFFRQISENYFQLYEANKPIPYLIENINIRYNFVKYFVAGYNRFIENYFLFKKSSALKMATALYIFNLTTKLAEDSNTPLLFISHDNEMTPVQSRVKQPFEVVHILSANKDNKISPEHGHINKDGHAFVANKIQKHLETKEGFHICKK